MFNCAFTVVRGASRIQARSLLRPPTRHALGIAASAARGRYEQRSHGSQQSHKSSGQGPRHGSRLPLRSTAVASFSILAVLAANSGNPRPGQPNCAFKDPSGWDYVGTEPSFGLDFAMRYSQALESNSIKEAREAHFELTRKILRFCVHGDIIEEGSVRGDVVFGPGQFVAKEDTRIFWMPSPVQDRGPVLCLSVHHDLEDNSKQVAFVDDVMGAEMAASCLKKFKDTDTHVVLHFHTPSEFFILFFPRDELANALERDKLLGIRE